MSKDARRRRYNEVKRNYRRTPKGYIVCLYNTIRSRVQRNKDYQGLHLLTREEFYAWAFSEEFERLFEEYKKSGWDRKLAPSVDRIVPEKGYAAPNMRWLTVSENSARSGKPPKLPIFRLELSLTRY